MQCVLVIQFLNFKNSPGRSCIAFLCLVFSALTSPALAISWDPAMQECHSLFPVGRASSKFLAFQKFDTIPEPSNNSHTLPRRLGTCRPHPLPGQSPHKRRQALNTQGRRAALLASPLPPAAAVRPAHRSRRKCGRWNRSQTGLPGGGVRSGRAGAQDRGTHVALRPGCGAVVRRAPHTSARQHAQVGGGGGWGVACARWAWPARLGLGLGPG